MPSLTSGCTVCSELLAGGSGVEEVEWSVC